MGERSVAEDLFLLCADPQTGVVKLPEYFGRALAGAVIAELALCGAFRIQDGQVVEIRVMNVADPVVGEVLGSTVDEVRLGVPDLQQVRLVGDADRPLPRVGGLMKILIAAASHPEVNAEPRRLRNWINIGKLDKRYIESLHARGLLIEQRGRMLGVLPKTVHVSAVPDHRDRVAGRVWRAVNSGHADFRGRSLAALAEVAGLGWRLFPGRENSAMHRRLEQIMLHDPIAVVVKEAMEEDAVLPSGG